MLGLLLSGCAQNEFDVTEMHVVPFVSRTWNGSWSEPSWGLSLYMLSTLSEDEVAEVTLTDPSGDFTWTKELRNVWQGEQMWKGSSDFMLPPGMLLPSGLWKAVFSATEGRKAERTFTEQSGESFNTGVWIRIVETQDSLTLVSDSSFTLPVTLFLFDGTGALLEEQLLTTAEFTPASAWDRAAVAVISVFDEHAGFTTVSRTVLR